MNRDHLLEVNRVETRVLPPVMSRVETREVVIREVARVKVTAETRVKVTAETREAAIIKALLPEAIRAKIRATVTKALLLEITTRVGIIKALLLEALKAEIIREVQIVIKVAHLLQTKIRELAPVTIAAMFQETKTMFQGFAALLQGL